MGTPSDRQTISELAYWLWEARGRREGHADEDWLEAECRVVGSALVATTPADLSKSVDESSKQSFPASDPPATHTADRPVANAGAKWAAANARRGNNGGKNTAAPKGLGRRMNGDAAPAPETPKVGSRDAPGG